jgi:hypothetical protein
MNMAHWWERLTSENQELGEKPTMGSSTLSQP